MAGDGSTWYVEGTETKGDSEDEEDVVDYDFMKLRMKHIIKHRKIVPGSMLITPNSFIFDPRSSDPLDQLEPEMFQVAAPAKKIVGMKILQNYFYKDNEGDTKEYKDNIYKGPDIDSVNSAEYVIFDKDGSGEDTEEDINVEEMFQPKLTIVNDKTVEETLNEDDIEKDLYLHIVMDTKDDIDDSIYISSYGSHSLQPCYWFVISRNQVPNIHSFLQTWFPSKYSSNYKEPELEDISQFVFVQDFYQKVEDTEDEEEEESEADEEEVASVRHPFNTERMFSVEKEDESQLLDQNKVKQLTKQLPPRCLAHSWQLIFSTWRHGFSLHSLYRLCSLVKEAPCLMVIRDTHKVTFGALVSEAPRISENFIGTGESWLFSFGEGSLSLYNWTGENTFIMQGHKSSLVVGSDEDGFGLWIDENLHQGTSKPVATFGNQCLASDMDFIIENIECWAFL